MKRINNLKLQNLSKGFTLIELLVVIGILAIMAAALIATLDPFEQIKKGQDAAIKQIAVEYLNGVTRYYGTHGVVPWDPSLAAPCTAPSSNAPTANCIQALVNDGELKSSFSNAANIGKLFVNYAAPSTVSLCFKPDSKAQKSDPSTKYTQGGLATCASGPNSACYWCTQ